MTPSFEEQLEAAIQLAVRAPSSHNGQPWALATVRSEAAREALDQVVEHSVRDRPILVLALDRDRELTGLPAHLVEMYVSCGLFLALLLEGLDKWTPMVLWTNEAEADGGLPLPGWPERWRPLIALAFDPASEPRKARDALVHGRVTNRAPYQDRAVPAAVLDGLRDVDATGRPPGVRRVGLEIIDDRARISGLGAFVGAHAAIDFTHRVAWPETYGFIRWSQEAAEAAGDGFAITQLFGPMSWFARTFYRFALAPLTMRALAAFGYADKVARELGAIVTGTPVMYAFSFEDEHPGVAEQIFAGAAVMEFLLRATAEGLVTHPVSVVLQHPEIRTALEREHHLAGRVFFFARMGYPSVAFPSAPRRSAAALEL